MAARAQLYQVNQPYNLLPGTVSSVTRIDDSIHSHDSSSVTTPTVVNFSGMASAQNQLNGNLLSPGFATSRALGSLNLAPQEIDLAGGVFIEAVTDPGNFAPTFGGAQSEFEIGFSPTADLAYNIFWSLGINQPGTFHNAVGLIDDQNLPLFLAQQVDNSSLSTVVTGSSSGILQAGHTYLLYFDTEASVSLDPSTGMTPTQFSNAGTGRISLILQTVPEPALASLFVVGLFIAALKHRHHRT